MHEFGAVKECPKCGAERELCNACWQQASGKPCYNFYTGSLVLPCPEHLKWRCSRCGYSWQEKTRDDDS